ncbi:AbiH family protein [Chishuiella sp.]|uniref:AbiH family protein n=1 Tax=Chishuiella sp. TaxID=1969467 RepID=UPI0028AFEF11|nr:AbiH family protein [Chishuiella sp.]
MNRVILIGNGFDKGIGLPTLYGDFMKWLIDDIIKSVNIEIENKKINITGFEEHVLSKIKEKAKYIDYDDNFIRINTIDFSHFNKELFFDKINNGVRYHSYSPDKDNFNDLKQITLHNQSELNSINSKIVIKNIILSLLIKNYNTNSNWGNIEQIFYDELIKTSDNKIEKLNKDFSMFTNKLEEYLKTINIESIINSKSKEYIDYIKENIYSNDLRPSYFCPIKIKEKLIEINCDLNKCNQTTINDFYKRIGFKGFPTDGDFIEYFINEDKNLNILDDEFTIDNYLFLNFNYTNTPTYFTDENEINFHINIHGDLTDNQSSPIIFGFGDELDENYKILEDKNNNHFLKHIKSINYLKNNSYRKLIEFLESKHFQLFILGHSCGTSDRTLLNTVFEHDNCISIVPFIRTDDDNYQDTIMNIYRNFTDKRKLRNRVVNKELCKNLTLD